MTDLTRPLSEDSRFRAYYQLHLEPLERQFEQLRLAARRERTKRLGAAFVLWSSALAIGIYWLRPGGDIEGLLFGLMVLAGLLLGVWAWAPVLAHTGRVKEQVIPRLVPFPSPAL